MKPQYWLECSGVCGFREACTREDAEQWESWDCVCGLASLIVVVEPAAPARLESDIDSCPPRT